MSKLTAERVRELLSLDPTTGVFTWIPRKPSDFTDGIQMDAKTLCRRWNTKFAGKTAGHLNRIIGYITIRIGTRLYLAHRLAWLHTNGEWPPNQIDHRDQRRADNRLANLRLATGSQNLCNRGLTIRNTSGAKDISWRTTRRKWRARITLAGREIHLGYFDTKQEAAEAYGAAAKKYHGEFARS